MEDLKRLAGALDLRKLRLPSRPKVEELRVEPYLDSTGDKALRVWVVFAEDTPDEDRIWLRVERPPRSRFARLLQRRTSLTGRTSGIGSLRN